MGIDFDNPGMAVKPPSKLAHIVLRTNNMKAMVDFYCTFLGGRVVHESKMLAFLTYDDEHHRIAFVQIPKIKPKVCSSCGLEHIAFSFNSLSELLLAYCQRKQNSILPIWCVNYGATTSMYYKDPDGNEIETQTNNFKDPNDATKYMESPEFSKNPIGVDFDPEDIIKRFVTSNLCC